MIQRRLAAQWRQISVDDISSWPRSMRVLVLLLMAALIVLAGWRLLIDRRLDQLARASAREAVLVQRYQQRFAQIPDLAAAQQQLSALDDALATQRAAFTAALELPVLIDDISAAALASGLLIERLSPGSRRDQDGFEITPIQVVMTGRYHQLGQFMAALSALSVPVSVHQLTIRRLPDESTVGPLSISFEARAYRYPLAGNE